MLHNIEHKFRDPEFSAQGRGGRGKKRQEVLLAWWQVPHCMICLSVIPQTSSTTIKTSILLEFNKFTQALYEWLPSVSPEELISHRYTEDWGIHNTILRLQIMWKYAEIQGWLLKALHKKTIFPLIFFVRYLIF